MWRRVRNGDLAEVLPQASGIQPTSGQAVELASTHDVRRNVLRHLRQEIEAGIPADGYFADVHGSAAYKRHLTYHFAEQIRAELARPGAVA